MVVFLLLGGLLFYLDVRYDERFEQHVSTKVETYVEKKYGPAHVVSLHSAYDDKHRDKEKRYQIAVKVQGQGLQKEEYFCIVFKMITSSRWAQRLVCQSETKSRDAF